MENETLWQIIAAFQSGILLNLLINWLIKKQNTKKYVKGDTSIQLIEDKSNINTNFTDNLISDGWIRKYKPWYKFWK